MMKTCYMCEHLASNEDPDEWRYHGSDLTPPTEFKIFCRKNIWSYYEGPIDELREGLLKAHDCPHFELLPQYAPIQPVEDYVGHIPRLPYCKSCGTNLITKQQVIKSDGTFADMWKSFCPTCDDTWKQHPTLQGVYKVELT